MENIRRGVGSGEKGFLRYIKIYDFFIWRTGSLGDFRFGKYYFVILRRRVRSNVCFVWGSRALVVLKVKFKCMEKFYLLDGFLNL